MATDGSLLGKTAKWEACDWAVVQLDYDEEVGPMHGMWWLDGSRIRGPAHYQEGGADGFPMILKESDWAGQDPC